MSWSLYLIRTRTSTEPYGKEKYEDIIPFTKDEIIKTLSEISGLIDVRIENIESKFVNVWGENWRIEICFWEQLLFSEKDMTYCTIELEVRGITEPKEFLSLLTGKLNARLFDMSSGKFWICDGSGFADWKKLCDRIASELSNENIHIRRKL
ncbi:MAG: hypothetical protein NC177_00990 [Ruminococcus flavefaciens]|nr:hypothetical protein [Ruminococcus flavefaciens]